MVGPQLVPKDNEAGNRATKKVSALEMAPVECRHKGAIPPNHEGY